MSENNRLEVLHEDLVTLTEWMARHDFSADDLAYAVAKPWKYVHFLDRARADLDPEE